MDAGSGWLQDIAKAIAAHRERLGRKDSRHHRLGLLLRVARRVDEFSVDCDTCRELRPAVSALVDGLERAPFTKEERRTHLKASQGMAMHLRKQHKLKFEGQHVALGLSLGAGVGAGFGAALENVAAGLALGVAVGLALGAALDAKARNAGKVI